MKKNNIKYFLAANSCEGFYSEFDNSYLPDGEWRAYIIKGGPGTGKSSFMKRFADAAENKGERALRCPCSSDPDSLDAVILPDKKIVIMDGTAPHTVDPKFPGVCEKILNFGEFWVDDSFAEHKSEVIRLTLKNKALHASAARFLRAAGTLLTDNYKTALACTDITKTEQFAAGLCKKLLPEKKNAAGREWVRFVGGITPVGVVSYHETVTGEAERLVIISDEYGSAANIIVNAVRSRALNSGYEIITLKNPFLPSLITDHVIIPELGLAVVTENSCIKFESNERRIHARRFVVTKQLHLSRERMKFNRKAANELLITAAKTLSTAKAVHDKLEAYYINAMDFGALGEFFDKNISGLIGL